MQVGRIYTSIVALVALSAFLRPAIGFEYSGFRMGMSEAEIFTVARRSGYQLRQTDNGYIWQGSGGASGYISLCNGKVFAAGSTIDANFHTFMGLVRERQVQYGEPVWKANQQYSTEGQQLSTLEAQWDDPVGRFQPSVSLLAYGATNPRVAISYSAHKYMCRR
jgi:hypothetical protein